MSFWGTLGRIAGDVGGAFVGDPLLGEQVAGGVDALSGLFGGDKGNLGTDLGQSLNAMAAARAKARIDAGNLAIKRGELGKDLYTASLGSKALENNLDAQNYGQTMKGLTAAHMQDVVAQAPDNVAPHITHFTGGIRPSNIGDEGRALGGNYAKMMSARIGNEGLPSAPELPEIPDGNIIDSLLTASGAASGLMGIAGKYLPLLKKTKNPILSMAGGGNDDSDNGLDSFWNSDGEYA